MFSGSVRRTAAIVALAFAQIVLAVTARALVADGFNPRVNGNVYAIAVQPDGSTLVGGAFTTIESTGTVTEVLHINLARINADGTTDETFTPQFDGDVTALAIQPDGKIVVGGRFSTVTTSAGTAARKGLARLNKDGSIDTTFKADVSGQPNAASAVYAIAVQSDGKVLVGGAFTAVVPNGATASTARSRFMRLTSTGALDTAFDPKPNNFVYSIALQRDGKILLGGGFTSLTPNGATSSTARTRFARLNTDGTIDTSHNTRANNRVLAIAVQADGMAVISGDFTTLQTDADESAITRTFIGRIRADGSIDGDFDPGANASVATIAIQRDGKILAGGSFTSFRPANGSTIISRRYLARITMNGAIDSDFSAAPNGTLTGVAAIPDGRIVIGGYFTAVQGSQTGTSVSRMRLARLQSDGAVDTGFGAENASVVALSAVQSTGKIIVAGSFSTFGGLTRYNIARLSTDGTVDVDFKPKVNGSIQSMAIQSDGKILIGGSFTEVNDTQRTYLARLTADGVLDADFHPDPNSTVYSILLASDGDIYLGGAFTAFNRDQDDDTDPVSGAYLVRLNSDGSKDDGFQPGVNGAIFSLVRQSDGKLLVGGSYSALQGHGGTAVTRYYLGRLNADGTLDEKFNPTPNSSVGGMIQQSDGKIVVFGSFTTMNPGNSSDVDPVTRTRIARLNADGTLDTTFIPEPNAGVSSMVLQSSGKFMVGGSFLTFNKEVRRRLVRMNSDGTVDTSFELNGDSTVYTINVDGDGKLLVGGAFTALQAPNSTTVAAEDHFVRLKADGSVDTAFQVRVGSSFTGRADALAIQADGRIVVGGSFADVGGLTNKNLVRYTASEGLDTGFNPKPDGAVRSILVRPATTYDAGRGNLFARLNSNGSFDSSFSLSWVSQLSGVINVAVRQPNGQILVGGSFTDTGSGDRVGFRLARYNANGTPDTSFNPAPDASVTAIALQSDGKILVGGSFVNIGGYVRKYIARLNSDGSVDTSFNPKANQQINSFIVLSDGDILVGGAFTSFDPNSTDETDTDTTTRAYIGRLNSDGTVDSGFNPSANGIVATMVQRSDGKILVGGSFSTIGGETRVGLALLNTDGSVVSAFNPNMGGSVTSVVIQSDGKLVVGGSFSTVNPNSTDSDDAVDRHALARLNADGTLDTTYDPNANGIVETLALAPDGKVYVGGSFTGFEPGDSENEDDTDAAYVARNRIARLNTDGTIDSGFNPDANSTVSTLLVDSDSGDVFVGGAFTQLSPEPLLYVGGDFTAINTVSVPRLARLNTDGNPDTSFLPNPNAPVQALAYQADGKILVGGEFTSLLGSTRNRIARLTATGALDTTFDPNADGFVYALAVQTDGQVVLGGSFATVAGAARSRLARVTATGALDTGFSPSLDGTVLAIAMLSDGRMLVAGEFGKVGSVSRPYLARLNSDGSLDTTFAPTIDGRVNAVVLQADGNILIGGSFTTVNGTARSRFARLTKDGALDTSLVIDTDAEVLALALQRDGRPVLAGKFTTAGGGARLLVARFLATTSATESFGVGTDLKTMTWLRGGSSPEASSVDFSYSTDNTNWTTLGTGTRRAGGWEFVSGTTMPSASNYYIRLRAILPTSQHGSGSVMVTNWQMYGTLAAGQSATSSTSGTDDTGSNSGSTGSNENSNTGSGSGSTDSGTDSSTANLRVAALSVRVSLPGSDKVIAGLVIKGTETQQVLVRAIGPGLVSYGVSSSVAMARPALSVYDASGNLVVTNEGWGGKAALSSAFARTGAFALSASSLDSALLVTLAPGNYTIHANDAAGVGGVVLVEAYDANVGTVDSRLGAISARGPAGSGNATLIAGLALGGTESRTILIRGVGPALTTYGVTSVISDPVARVYDVQGNLVAENDNWVPSTALTEAVASTGVFSLPSGSADAALLISLAPGSYTVQVSDRSGGSGQALIEVYELR